MIEENLKSDGRFYINAESLEYITRRPIDRYIVKEICIGDIRRKWKGEILSLSKTEPYRYLEHGKSDSGEYFDYCKVANVDNSKRSIETFNNLINQFDVMGYDMHKGAIVVDQFNFILDGQHRACILLKQHGAKYKVPVVQVHYQDYGLGTWFLNTVFNLKKAMGLDC